LFGKQNVKTILAIAKNTIKMGYYAIGIYVSQARGISIVLAYNIGLAWFVKKC
jgi:hypothetical protein